MDVYLIPLGGSRHELYSEVEADDVAGDVGASPRSSWWRRQVDRFRSMLAEAEAERARRDRGEASEARGLGRHIVGRIAEAIAEQRLLWQLRKVRSARLVHPDDLTGADALAIARTSMRLDYRKHLRWCAIDSMVAAITGPLLFFVPGPNVISWYFAFRAIGHFYALRGARQGLDVVSWDTAPASALSNLRAALALGPVERRAQLEELASGLGLDRLAAFVDRVSPRPS
jgi:hypothetical protein